MTFINIFPSCLIGVVVLITILVICADFRVKKSKEVRPMVQLVIDMLGVNDGWEWIDNHRLRHKTGATLWTGSALYFALNLDNRCPHPRDGNSVELTIFERDALYAAVQRLKRGENHSQISDFANRAKDFALHLEENRRLANGDRPPETIDHG